MRLLLLPISTRRVLVYCEPIANTLPQAQRTYIDRGVTYATKTWTEWESSPTNWKLKLTSWGNKMLRRIPYEEWGLKSIPSISVKRKEEYSAGQKVDIRYPSLYWGLGKESVLDACMRLSTERQGLHRQRLYGSVAAMPFTIPFGLIPVLPNIPFFYLAFRAYSHFRAIRGSQHLEHLVKADALRLAAFDTLDSLYSAGLLYTSAAECQRSADPTSVQNQEVVSLIRKQMTGGGRSRTASSPTSSVGGEEKGTVNPAQGQSSAEKSAEGQEEIMLLKGWNGKLIAERLELPGLQVEIERAVEQVERDLKRVEQPRAEKGETETSVEKSPTK